MPIVKRILIVRFALVFAFVWLGIDASAAYYSQYRIGYAYPYTDSEGNVTLGNANSPPLHYLVNDLVHENGYLLGFRGSWKVTVGNYDENDNWIVDGELSHDTTFGETCFGILPTQQIQVEFVPALDTSILSGHSGIRVWQEIPSASEENPVENSYWDPVVLIEPWQGFCGGSDDPPECDAIINNTLERILGEESLPISTYDCSGNYYPIPNAECASGSYNDAYQCCVNGQVVGEKLSVLEVYSPPAQKVQNNIPIVPFDQCSVQQALVTALSLNPLFANPNDPTLGGGPESPTYFGSNCDEHDGCYRNCYSDTGIVSLSAIQHGCDLQLYYENMTTCVQAYSNSQIDAVTFFACVRAASLYTMVLAGNPLAPIPSVGSVAFIENQRTYCKSCPGVGQ